MNFDSILKSLGGGVVVYVAIAACGSGWRNEPTPVAEPESVADGSMGGMRGSDSGTTTNGVGNIMNGDAMVGVVDALTDPVGDAMAQPDTSTCGTCTVAGPIVLAGPVKMMTAETDPAQALSGRIPGGDDLLVAEGPLYLTDARSFVTTNQSLYSVIGTDCTATTIAWNVSLPSQEAAIHGARLFVPVGSSLCASLDGAVTWAGFRPYVTQ
jgi:hypothetical protein